MSAESFYRRLLRVYPRSYRDHRGEELLATLLDGEDGGGSRARRRARAREAAALVRHGIALRARTAGLSVRDRLPSLGLAGVALAVVLGVLGLHQLTAMAVRASGLHGFPSAWGVYVQWVDPRWPVHVAWLAVALSLLARRAGATVVVAWTAAVLHGWFLTSAAATGGEVPWVGNAGPYWLAPAGTAELGWFVLSVGSALLLGGGRRTARSLAAIGPGPLRRTALLGGLVAVASVAAGPVLRALAKEVTGPPYRIEGPLPALLLTAAVLTWSLLRVAHGRAALLVLVLLASAPLASRWTESFAAAAGAMLLFAAGYLVASLRTAPVPGPGRPAR
jgi:hypothetical protein